MSSVIVADSPPECEIRGIAAELLNPGVLIRGHRLLRELASDPVGELRQDDGFPRPERRERGCAATEPAANHGDVDSKLVRLDRLSCCARQTRPRRKQTSESEATIFQEVPAPHGSGPLGSKGQFSKRFLGFCLCSHFSRLPAIPHHFRTVGVEKVCKLATDPCHGKTVPNTGSAFGVLKRV